MSTFLAVFVGSYILHALGVTIGYHRLLSHRAFSCPKPVEYFWVLLGYLAFEGSPIWWATIHRAHHKHVDTPLDPHSPRFGVKYAWYGWLLEKGYLPQLDPTTQCVDLVKDPLYRFLEQDGNFSRAHGMGFATCFLFRIAIWYCFGWQAALASLLAGFAVLQIPLMLNVFCHIPKLGYRNYAVTDDSVNVWWVGLLAVGEGWHNNHHAAPGSARTGMKPWEFDLSWIVISVMDRLKLVSDVHVLENKKLLIGGGYDTPEISKQLATSESEFVLDPTELYAAQGSNQQAVAAGATATAVMKRAG